MRGDSDVILGLATISGNHARRYNFARLYRMIF
jgi:hypothetical protein